MNGAQRDLTKSGNLHAPNMAYEASNVAANKPVTAEGQKRNRMLNKRGFMSDTRFGASSKQSTNFTGQAGISASKNAAYLQG